MSRTISNPTRVALIVLAFAGAAVWAQNALDANLNALGGRTNPVAPQLSAAPELYTVNRESGELVYNRANAFNDNVYTPYQRYVIDRERYFVPGQGPRGTQANTAGGVRAQYTGPRVATAAPPPSGLGAGQYRPTTRSNSVSASSRQTLNRVSYRVR